MRYRLANAQGVQRRVPERSARTYPLQGRVMYPQIMRGMRPSLVDKPSGRVREDAKDGAGASSVVYACLTLFSSSLDSFASRPLDAALSSSSSDALSCLTSYVFAAPWSGEGASALSEDASSSHLF
jgi:hypothetical protein